MHTPTQINGEKIGVGDEREEEGVVREWGDYTTIKDTPLVGLNYY